LTAKTFLVIVSLANIMELDCPLCIRPFTSQSISGVSQNLALDEENLAAMMAVERMLDGQFQSLIWPCQPENRGLENTFRIHADTSS
jgi:hypothetical protein